ncbi:MAG TPA: RNA polymerase sigma factor [Actinoplanes sp.]|nr:RNA polymerase sigma factor [Actinoplanes sp.]
MDDDRTPRFEALYAATFPLVLGYALRRCDGPEDAADVAAETFAVAWRRMDAIPPGEQARLWLYGVARNVLANHRRGLARRHELSAALAAEVTKRYEPSAEDCAGLHPVGALFRQLSDVDRELLSLVAWEGLDPGGIAVVLGCSRNAVRIRLHRARRRFAALLEAAGVETDQLTTSGRQP